MSCRISPRATGEQLFLPYHYKPGAGEPERYRKAAQVPLATPAQEARRIVDAAE